jgi:hypothetical protein
MYTIITFLHSIPDVVWSGIVASFLTLSGVLISNWDNTRRLKRQLQHDSDEKAKERTAALRREVYLNAAEELTKASSHLGSLSRIDLTKADPSEGLKDFFGAAAKLQLVAEPKTALLVNQLVGAYGELVIKLIAALMPLQLARADIDLNNGFYEKSQAEIDRILAEMTRFNETVQKDQSVFLALQNSYKFRESQAAEYARLRAAGLILYNRLTITFNRTLLTDLRHLLELQIPVFIEIRRDLGLIGELDVFRTQMRAQWEKISKQFDAVLLTIENMAASPASDRIVEPASTEGAPK